MPSSLPPTYSWLPRPTILFYPSSLCAFVYCTLGVNVLPPPRPFLAFLVSSPSSVLTFLLEAFAHFSRQRPAFLWLPTILSFIVLSQLLLQWILYIFLNLTGRPPPQDLELLIHLCFPRALNLADHEVPNRYSLIIGFSLSALVSPANAGGSCLRSQ